MMKKPILLILGMMIISNVAAQDNLKISGQIRHRAESVDKTFDATEALNFSALRTRLNLDFKPAENLSVFVQFQDSRKFGEEKGGTLSEGNTTFDDSLEVVKSHYSDFIQLHQAYFKITNLMGLPVSLKVGRFEVNYGPQRLIGAVGWSNIGRSFDGYILNYSNDILNLDVFNFHTIEAGMAEDIGDKNVRGVYANLNIMEGIKPDVFFIQDDKMNTLGTYIKGAMAGFNFEIEFASQSGSKDDDTDVAGLMYGLNAGMKLAGISITAGLDYISGDDTTTSEYEAFNTLYATNHKYYGYMDYFVNLPKNTEGRGLKDMYIKAGLKPIMGVAPSLAYHIFSSDQENSAGETDFGSELDVTLKHGYNDKVTFVAGYSMFIPGALQETDDENATFMYLMTIVNF